MSVRGRVFTKKVREDGYVFDSQMEYQRYIELKSRKERGLIRHLVIHPTFLLQPAFDKKGKKYSEINYEADFQYEKEGTIIIEDVKGFLFDDFVLKQKMFEYHYPDKSLSVITLYQGEFQDFNEVRRAKNAKKRNQLKQLRESIKAIEALFEKKDCETYHKALFDDSLPLYKGRPTGKNKNQLNELKHRHYQLSCEVKKERKRLSSLTKSSNRTKIK